MSKAFVLRRVCVGASGRQASCSALCASSVVGLSHRLPFLASLAASLVLVLVSL